MQKKNATVKTNSNQKKFVNPTTVGSKPPKKSVSDLDQKQKDKGKSSEAQKIAREAANIMASETRSLISHYDSKAAAAKRKQFAYGFKHPLDFKNTWDFVKGSAMDVLRLAPAALNIGGLLMTKHAPTQANALAAGRSDLIAQYTAPSGGPIPLQQGGLGSFSNCVGISSMKAINKNGLLYGQRCVGMDKLFDVPEVNPITGAVWAEGDLMASVDLNPTGPDWAGTALIQQSRIYNRYKVNKMCFLYATNVAATDEGSLILSVTPDPDSQYTGVGTTGTQLATAVTGAETCSIWAAGCTSWYGDRKQNFYSRPDGTDPRFTSPGILNVVCNAVLNVDGSGTTVGSVYVLYDIELTERSLEDSNQYMQFYALAAAVSGQTGPFPFGTPQIFNGQSQGFLATVTGALAADIVTAPELKTVFSAAYPGGSLATQVQYSSVSSKGVLSGFPIGDYLLTLTTLGTGLASGVANVVNVGNPYYVAFYRTTLTAAAATALTQTMLLRVLKQTTSAESYVDFSSNSTTCTSSTLWCTKFGDAASYQAVPQSIMRMGQDIAVLKKQLEALLQGVPEEVKKTKERHPDEFKFDLGQLVTPREMSENRFKWVNQHQERVCPSDKGYAFVVWSNQPDKLKVVSVSRILVDTEGTDRARTHNYELAARVFCEYQLWKSHEHEHRAANLAYGKSADVSTAGIASPQPYTIGGLMM